MKRKKLLAFGMGIVMGLSPVSVFAAQQEDISDKMLENNVIMQTEEVLIEEEAAEEGVQDQMDVLEQEEGLSEVLGENDVEEMELTTVNEEATIDGTNFPDAVFRQYVLDMIDGDGDGRLSDVEIENTKCIDVSFTQGMDKICSLKGIEYFTALQELDCSENQLSSLDVSHNLALGILNCDNNQLSSLDVSHNEELYSLWCDCNQLSSLDVSRNEVLMQLSCANNQLSSLDVSHNEALDDLHCYNNQLSNLDVSHDLALRYMNCENNQLSSLDVRLNEELYGLYCGNNQLSSLDVSHNEALESLDCSDNQLSSLDVSHNLILGDLYCSNNQLSSLDVSHNEALERLLCGNNQLSSLDVSHNLALEDLHCEDNQLSIDGRQINILLYDNKFEVGKVSNLQKLSLDGDIFTILDGNKSGTYDYDCGNSYTMTVTISENVKEPVQEIKYEDVEEIPGNWKYESVKYISERGIMGGVGGSNQFQPDNSLTRAMFATVLYRIAGEPNVEYSNKFSDVESGKWYSDAIIWANQKGIVSGYSDGSYGIDDNITREQIAKMLYLYGQSQGYDVSGVSSLDSFTDKTAVSGWATVYMRWAVNAQMISGKPNGDGTFRLDPKGQATRAECAKMLMMFMEKYK